MLIVCSSYLFVSSAECREVKSCWVFDDKFVSSDVRKQQWLCWTLRHRRQLWSGHSGKKAKEAKDRQIIGTAPIVWPTVLDCVIAVVTDRSREHCVTRLGCIPNNKRAEAVFICFCTEVYFCHLLAVAKHSHVCIAGRAACCGLHSAGTSCDAPKQHFYSSKVFITTCLWSRFYKLWKMSEFSSVVGTEIFLTSRINSEFETLNMRKEIETSNLVMI